MDLFERFVESSGDDVTIGFEGIYLEISNGRRLVFSWTKFTEHSNGETDASPLSLVEITFTETESGTDMRIVHSSVDASSGGFAVGWNAGIGNLSRLLESIGDDDAAQRVQLDGER